MQYHLSVHLSVYQFLYQPLCLYTFMSDLLQVRRSVSLHAYCMFVIMYFLSVCMPACMHVYPFICPYVCLPESLSVCLFVFQSVCLPVYLAACLSRFNLARPASKNVNMFCMHVCLYAGLFVYLPTRNLRVWLLVCLYVCMYV